MSINQVQSGKISGEYPSVDASQPAKLSSFAGVKVAAGSSDGTEVAMKSESNVRQHSLGEAQGASKAEAPEETTKTSTSSFSTFGGFKIGMGSATGVSGSMSGEGGVGGKKALTDW